MLVRDRSLGRVYLDLCYAKRAILKSIEAGLCFVKACLRNEQYFCLYDLC